MTRLSIALGFALVTATALIAQQQAPAPQPPTPQTTGQQTPSPRPSQPTFRSEANYIRVDAFVTRDGVPIENLTLADFEVLEDGVPQKIDAFEYVRVVPAGPQVTRIEPNSQQNAQQMAGDPRARIFVVFLDLDNVPVEGSYRLKTALATMLNQMLGADDFIGVLTTRHSPSDLILGRKTALIEEQLEKYWYWGRKDSIVLSPDEELYVSCFERFVGGEQIAAEMIERRREKLALDALSDLVIHLRGLREERKAVLTVSAGWPLFRENQALTRALVLKGDPNQTERVPPPPRIGIGPGGRPMMSNDPAAGSGRDRCEQHRQELSMYDGWQAFQDLTQDANRANVSFYPIDPRGLVVFDSSLSRRVPLSLTADREILRARENALRSMADQTDGLAVVHTNDLASGLKRITADLTSYYLLGYYSSNTALDGKYHRITVRVKRPGATVRARKGYRAASREEVARGETLSSAAATPSGNNAVANALNRLSLIRPDASLYVHATHVPGGALWIAGEIPTSLARSPAWASGARISIVSLDGTGNTVGVGRHVLPAGDRAFLIRVPVDDPKVSPARVQVRAEPTGAAAIGLEVAPTVGEPLLLRRSGPSAPRAAADFRYFRTETMIYRWPLQSDERASGARVLDRMGNAIAVPTAPAEETIDGARWLAGTLVLAPLVNGDYLLELTKRSDGGESTVMVPFRIVR